MRTLSILTVACCILGPTAESVREASDDLASVGWQLLRTKSYLPADFSQTVIDDIWRVWPVRERNLAAKASPAERRQMIFSRYGLMEPPEGSGTGPALGYVDDGKGGWVMSCLACHAGKVAGRVIPGLPNSHFALHSLVEDVWLTKLRLFERPAHLDLASFKMPLGTTHGTTNSVIFGVLLAQRRDLDMQVVPAQPARRPIHHDMDAPPFWNVKKKLSLYADGFAPKNHRVLMQFVLLPENGADTLTSWEDDYRAILAWIESLQPPAYPFDVDRALANEGRVVFESHCSSCHGTYGPEGEYEQTIVALDKVGTDPVRLNALTREHREWLRDGWMSNYGQDEVDVDPVGYVAPPLDGIWATAPYFHNGSVPTLWHVLHPDERPIVWKRTENGFDQNRVGLEIQTFDDVPSAVDTPYGRRQHFDTRRLGKSAQGHLFLKQLTEPQRRVVLEFLKTL